MIVTIEKFECSVRAFLNGEGPEPTAIEAISYLRKKISSQPNLIPFADPELDLDIHNYLKEQRIL